MSCPVEVGLPLLFVSMEFVQSQQKRWFLFFVPFGRFFQDFREVRLVKTKGAEEVQNSKFLFMGFCIRKDDAFATVHEQDQV